MRKVQPGKKVPLHLLCFLLGLKKGGDMGYTPLRTGVLVCLFVAAVSLGAQQGSQSPGGEQQAIIHVPDGFEVVVPEGWTWTEFDFRELQISTDGHQGKLGLGISKNPVERLPEQGAKRRQFPDGSEAWWLVQPYDEMQYFEGRVRRADTVFKVDTYFEDKLDEAKIEQGFLKLAERVRPVPSTQTARRPDTSFGVEVPEGWSLHIEAEKPYIELWRYSTHIYISPAVKTAISLEQAMAGVSETYAKQDIHGSEINHLSFAACEALWTEARNTQVPYWGVVSCGGKLFVVNVKREGGGPSNEPSENLKAFLSSLQSLRP